MTDDDLYDLATGPEEPNRIRLHYYLNTED